jgi:transposase-like protein
MAGVMIDPVTGEIIDQKELAERLLSQAKDRGVSPVGPGGLLNQPTKNVLETALEAELTEHLGHEHGRKPVGANMRNGTRSKTVLTDIGPVEIEVPRDWDGSFEPVIVPKRKRRLDGTDEIVLSLSARGLTTGEFGGHFEEVYGARISNDTISTEKVAAELVEWSSRPPQVFSELKSQGVEDVLIAVCDGLKGLPEAITTTWDRTIVQQCIVHLIRNSFRYAGRQHRDGIVKGSQTRATAPSEQAANQILRPTGGGRARWTMRWKPALNAFAITFAGRFKKAPTNENRRKPTHRLSDGLLSGADHTGKVG